MMVGVGVVLTVTVTDVGAGVCVQPAAFVSVTLIVPVVALAAYATVMLEVLLVPVIETPVPLTVHA